MGDTSVTTGGSPDALPAPDVYYNTTYTFEFGGWLWLLAVLLLVLLAIRVWRLGRRMAALDARLAMLLTSVPAPAAAAAAGAGTDAIETQPDAPPEAAPRISSRGLPWPDLVPEAPETAQPEPRPEATDQNRPLVLRADRIGDLGRWIRHNWVYAVSAASLALAGVYFVQYGIEKGLLSPAARVAGALALGAALIVAGEWLRRRQRPGGATMFLPATFAGAGLVSIYAAVIAAERLYGLIGSETAFAGLVMTAALAVLLGWFHGPFLTAVGLIGGAAAPFAVGGGAEDPYWLYGWYVAIGAVGLAVDAARRWAWISVLALALAYAGLLMILGGVGGPGWFGLALTVMAILTLLLPVWSLTPVHDGPTVTGALLRAGRGAWPGFPTRLAAGALLASTAGLVLAPAQSVADSQILIFCLAGLFVALALWAADAPALSDLAALPLLGFLIRLGNESISYQPLAESYHAQRILFRLPESSGPQTAALLLGLAVVLSLAAAWRSGHARRTAGGADPRLDRHAAAVWAAAAALAAPVAAVLLELFWAPRLVIGPYPWALHVMAVAVLMAVLAERFARADGEDRRRAAHAVLSCLSLVALALFIVISKAALTVALGVLLVVAALLDRRFRLPEMGWFIQAGVVVLGYRLLVDPGLDWAIEAPLWELWLAFGGAILGMVAGWVALPDARPGPRLMLETGLASAGALLANVLTVRVLDTLLQAELHWVASLGATPWLVVALVQLWRMRLGGWMRWLRLGLATVAGLIWLVGILVALSFGNPLADGRVAGPMVFDTLALAYAVPGAMLVAGRILAPWRWLRLVLAGLGGALLTFYAALEIRRWFQGDDLSLPGVSQGELYAYTVAMMLAAAVLFLRALRTGSRGRRWAAMALIALTIAKVFLIDASGLSGLMRVVSFLALGLALAGVAFLNRWVASRERGHGAEGREGDGGGKDGGGKDGGGKDGA